MRGYFGILLGEETVRRGEEKVQGKVRVVNPVVRAERVLQVR